MPADDAPVALADLGLSGGASAPPEEDPSSDLDGSDSADDSFGPDIMGSDSEVTDSDSERQAGEADLHPTVRLGTKKRTAEQPAADESSDEDPEPEAAATPRAPKKKRTKAAAAECAFVAPPVPPQPVFAEEPPAKEPKTGARVLKEGKTYRLVRPGTADFSGNKTAVRNLLRGSTPWTRFLDTDHGVKGIELLAISRVAKAAPSPAADDTPARGAAPPPTASEKPAGTLAAANMPPENKALKDMSLAEVKAYVKGLVAAKKPSEEDQRLLLVRGANEDRIREPFRGQLKAAIAKLGPKFLAGKLAELDTARDAAARAQSAALTSATAGAIQTVATTFAAYSKLVTELERMDVPAARLCNLANADEISLSSYADSLFVPDCSEAVRAATEALDFVRQLCVELEALIGV